MSRSENKKHYNICYYITPLIMAILKKSQTAISIRRSADLIAAETTHACYAITDESSVNYLDSNT